MEPVNIDFGEAVPISEAPPSRRQSRYAQVWAKLAELPDGQAVALTFGDKKSAARFVSTLGQRRRYGRAVGLYARLLDNVVWVLNTNGEPE